MNLIIEMQLGVMDGFYGDDTAADALAQLREKHPWGKWILAKVEESTYLNDHLFHAVRLKRVPPGLKTFAEAIQFLQNKENENV